ncbi:MAG TPA: DMT family transporter [Candidatus Dormibacteraeota bacterium]|nr:DMT family transporter [Candidatus Dormibacteraeota bacterium]
MQLPGPRSDRAGLAFVAVSALSFGTLGIFGKLASRHGITLPTLLGVRFGLAAVVLWALVLVRRDAVRLSRRRLAGVAAMGVLYVLQATAYFSSLRTIPAAITSILLYVYPVLVTLLARVVVAEPLTRMRVLSLGLACAGVLLVVGPSPAGHLDVGGVLLGLTSAVVYSTYILTGGVVMRGVPALFASAVITSVGGAAFLVFGAVTSQLNGLDGAGWGIVVGTAIVPTLIAATLFLAGLARVGPTRASIVSTLEPATTAVLAAIVLGEALSAVRLLGGVVVLAAAVLVALTGAAPARSRRGDSNP